jgi:hypothetical protein
VKQSLKRVTGRANEIAKAGNVRAIGPNSAGIDGKAETFGQIEIDPSIVEFGETETCGRRDTIHAGGVHRPRGAVSLPGTARQFVKLFPIAFVPASCHSAIQATKSFDAVRGRMVPGQLTRGLVPACCLAMQKLRYSFPILQGRAKQRKSSAAVSNT